MKNFFAMVLMLIFTISALAGCSTSSASTLTSGNDQSGNNFDTNKSISVVSREDGSGTIGAFIELFGIEVKADDGTKKRHDNKRSGYRRQNRRNDDKHSE